MEPKYCKKCQQTQEHWIKSDPHQCRDCHRTYHREYARKHYVPKPKKPYVQAEHLRPTVIPSDADMYWFAGFFEGEGSFNRVGHCMQIAQKDRWPLDFLRDRFGGYVGHYQRKDGRWYYKWWLTGPTCRALAAKIKPMLSPRRQAQATKADL